MHFDSLCKSLGCSIDDNKIKKADCDQYQNIKLTPYNVKPILSKERAVIYSGSENLCCENSFVQIGLGTLGSQIADNCIRTGYGKWIYIDNDIILPHNIARHCLNSDYIGKNKASSMKIYANKIIESNSVVQKCIEKDIFCLDIGDVREIIKSTDMIIDTSASVAAGRYICHNISYGTRCVSLFMNPSGTALVMLLESDDRKVKLDTLEMQSYRILVNKE